MNDISWHFRKMQKGEPNIDPQEEKFFTEEGVFDALVREAIQNSLDAKDSRKSGPVKVIFDFSGTRNKLNAEYTHRLLKNMAPHLAIDNNKNLFESSFLDRINSDGFEMEYLVIEDFNTTGLTGDIEQYQDINSERKNNFFYFWRNIARSHKSNTDRGRAGIGKNVFAFSSYLHSFFGVTIRSDDHLNLAMGQAVLKVHSINNDRYAPYGYFSSVGDEQFPYPFGSHDSSLDLNNIFKLSRDDKPGLSVIIPFPKEELLNPGKVLESIIYYYFLPILQEDLMVRVIDSNSETTDLNKSTMRNIFTSLLFDDYLLFKKNSNSFFIFVDWMLQVGVSERIITNLVGEDKHYVWGNVILDQKVIKRIRIKYNNEECIAIRIPIKVWYIDGNSQNSYFDIYLQKDHTLSESTEYYIRQGLTIPKLRFARNSSIRMILNVEDAALSSLLGDSENPAHTRWEQNESRLKYKYLRGRRVVKFVCNTIKELLNLISESPEGIEEDWLIEYFHLDISSNNRTGKRKYSILPIPDGKVEPISLIKVNGGCLIKQNQECNSIPKYINIDFAYAVQFGVATYSKYDFTLSNDGQFKTLMKNIEIVEQYDNLIKLAVLDNDFSFSITGFDNNRDLKINTKCKGELNEENF